MLGGWHKILELRVLGGFLDGQTVTFSPHLNCLVGGRGTGKTTVIELIRFALNAYPNDPSTRKKLQQHLVGILGNGKVRLLVETAGGQQYWIQRTVGSESPRITDAQGKNISLNLSQGLNYGVVIFGQSQLEQIAEMPEAQLALIDGKVPSISLLKIEIEACQKELKEKGMELSRAITEAQELSERLAVLPQVRERLQILAGEELDGLLERQRLREKELFFVSEIIRIVKMSIRQDKRPLAAACFMSENDNENLPNSDIIEEVMSVFSETTEQVTELINRTVILWEESLEDLKSIETVLAERHRIEEKEDEKIEAGLTVSGLHEAIQERSNLTALLLELEKIMRVLARKEQERANLAEQRLTLGEKLKHLQNQLFQQRRQACLEYNLVLEPEIQIQLVQGGNVQSYKELLAIALNRCGIHYHRLIDQLVTQISPAELVQIVKERDVRYLSQSTGLDTDRAERMVNYLAAQLTPAELFGLEDVLLDDLLDIRLRVGDDYKSTHVLSKGQKCTTLLPLLLLEDFRPLIIDQPEDHLDNEYIFNTVVPALFRVKSGRQIILATHNPNIPVNGEAENILVLKADGCCGRVALQGDLSQPTIKDALKWLLEGGPEALKGRVERYEKE